MAAVIQSETTDRDHRLIEWFAKWRKPIRSWFRNRASVPPGEIDDLAQEVFLRLLRYSDDIAVENPQGYLFRIAANVANEWRERSRVRKPHDDQWLDDLLEDSEHEPEAMLDHEQRDAYVHATVDALKPRQRQILLMHINDGMTYKQIAIQLGTTYRVVLRDLTKAYSTLRGQLEPPVDHRRQQPRVSRNRSGRTASACHAGLQGDMKAQATAWPG
jgi:RNA polymerase sigma factor (sigma-70 family)